MPKNWAISGCRSRSNKEGSASVSFHLRHIIKWLVSIESHWHALPFSVFFFSAGQGSCKSHGWVHI